MFVITCPYCGERDQSEFAHAGEAHISRPRESETMTDAEWAEFLFMRDNTKGIHAERWIHAAGCRRFFNALRNTATDRFLAFYRIGEKPPEIDDVVPATPCGEAVGSGNDAVKVERPPEAGR